MADIGKSIYSILSNNAAVAALTSTRIYPLVLPQGTTYPAIRYQIFGQRSGENLLGPGTLAESQLQVDCYATTPIESASVIDKVRLALNGYAGTAASVVIRQIHARTGRQGYEKPEGGEETGVYRHSRDFLLYYVEALS